MYSCDSLLLLKSSIKGEHSLISLAAKAKLLALMVLILQHARYKYANTTRQATDKVEHGTCRSTCRNTMSVPLSSGHIDKSLLQCILTSTSQAAHEYIGIAFDASGAHDTQSHYSSMGNIPTSDAVCTLQSSSLHLNCNLHDHI